MRFDLEFRDAAKGKTMFKKMKSLLVAMGVTVALLSASAHAAIGVTATQASGSPGQNADVTLNISGDGINDEVNMARISALTLNFFWDAAVLNLNSYTSSAPLPGAMFTSLGSGGAMIDWLDDTFSSPANFGPGLSITAHFNILPGAALGSTPVVFGDIQGSSILADDAFNSYQFNGVTSGTGMQVNVVAVPEPGELSMLLAGLGLMAVVVRRRKIWQAV